MMSFPHTWFYLESKAMQYCHETDNVCPKWCDDKIVNDLRFLDEKDGSNRVKEYLDTTHQLEVIFRPARPELGLNESEVKFLCKPYKINGIDKCDFCNKKAEDIMKKELNDMGYL